MARTIKLIVCIILSIAPLVYLSIIWRGLPAIVPTHFNMEGEANGYSPKGALWAINGGIAALTIGTYLLLNNLHRIDPKRRGALPAESFARLADGLVLFLSVINAVALLACSGHQLLMTKMVFPIIGLLFVFLGNMMYSLKPNYFAGIRLPWTLSDDANWRATHRIAGITWFIGGAVFAICSLSLPPHRIQLLLFAALAIMVLIPVFYSFWFFRRTAAKNQ